MVQDSESYYLGPLPLWVIGIMVKQFYRKLILRAHWAFRYFSKNLTSLASVRRKVYISYLELIKTVRNILEKIDIFFLGVHFKGNYF
jgi:hypothetical protein